MDVSKTSHRLCSLGNSVYSPISRHNHPQYRLSPSDLSSLLKSMSPMVNDCLPLTKSCQSKGHPNIFNCNNNVKVMNTTYKPNMAPPSNLVIRHLFAAMVITTATNMMKSKMVEQKRPEFVTLTSLKFCDMLNASHGKGNLLFIIKVLFRLIDKNLEQVLFIKKKQFNEEN